MNTLTSSTVNYSHSGKNIALALMGNAEKRGRFQLLAGEIARGNCKGKMCVQAAAGNGH